MFATDSKLDGYIERATQVGYALDAAIRENGYGSPLNEPFRAALDRADARVDRYRERLMGEAGRIDSLVVVIVAVCLLLLVGLTATVSGADAATVATQPRTCATINNTTNTVAWRTGSGPVQTATYRDLGGPRLVFDRPVPRAVRLAEGKLRQGEPGPKVARACT